MAYYQARAGASRAGAVHANLVPFGWKVTVAGVTRSPMNEGFRLTEQLGGYPTSGSIKFDNFEPPAGAEIQMYDDGSTRPIFGGTILGRSFRGDATRPTYDCRVQDWQFQMRKQVVYAKYVNLGANTVISKILGSFVDAAIGIRPGIIPSSLGNVTLTFVGESVPEAIDKVARAVSAFWVLTPDKMVHLFTSAYPDGNTLTLGNTQTTGTPGAFNIARNFQYTDDLAQTRTRIDVTAEGSSTVTVTAASATTILVRRPEPFSASGGQVIVDYQIITYTGLTVTTDSQGQLAGLLTGVTGVLEDIPAGQSISVFVRQNESAAQTALAAVFGGGLSGLITRVRRDQGLSRTEATAFAADEGALYSAAIKAVTYGMLNAHYKVGKVVTVSLTTPVTVSGTFRIQQVALQLRGDKEENDRPVLNRQMTLRPTLRQSLTDRLVDLEGLN